MGKDLKLVVDVLLKTATCDCKNNKNSKEHKTSLNNDELKVQQKFFY